MPDYYEITILPGKMINQFHLKHHLMKGVNNLRCSIP